MTQSKEQQKLPAYLKGNMLAQIRLNTKATGDHDRWRLTVDGKEYTVAKIIGLTFETSTMVIETGETKYCIEMQCREICFDPLLGIATIS